MNGQKEAQSGMQAMIINPDELDRYLQQRAQCDAFSGVALITQGSAQLFAGAYGYASRSWQIPNSMPKNRELFLSFASSAG